MSFKPSSIVFVMCSQGKTGPLNPSQLAKRDLFKRSSDRESRVEKLSFTSILAIPS